MWTPETHINTRCRCNQVKSYLDAVWIRDAGCHGGHYEIQISTDEFWHIKPHSWTDKKTLRVYLEKCFMGLKHYMKLSWNHWPEIACSSSLTPSTSLYTSNDGAGAGRTTDLAAGELHTARPEEFIASTADIYHQHWRDVHIKQISL